MAAPHAHPGSSLAPQPTEHFDVLIVGAGISGIGGAYHPQQCPGKSFVVLDALESFGGTWLTHTYPGIRSDSDLYTFGYRVEGHGEVPRQDRASAELAEGPRLPGQERARDRLGRDHGDARACDRRRDAPHDGATALVHLFHSGA